MSVIIKTDDFSSPHESSRRKVHSSTTDSWKFCLVQTHEEAVICSVFDEEAIVTTAMNTMLQENDTSAKHDSNFGTQQDDAGLTICT